MNQPELVALVNSKEPDAITRGLAMMAYIPAIGRVLGRGGVDRFADLMVETVPKFYGFVSRESFDTIHADTCEMILRSLKTNRGGTLSYGQAQKPLNVFLKVYVDWAHQPTRGLAEKLAPLLHVPLDGLLMGFISREFPAEYEKHILALRKRLASLVAERMETTAAKVERVLLATEFSLAGMNRELYSAWQGLLRALYPGKPISLDVVWVLERMRLRSEGAAGPEMG